MPVLLVHLDYASGGFIGVTLFFALSGFLIASLLLEELDRTETIRLKSFYIRRMARLYPALLAMIIMAVVIGLTTGKDPIGMFLVAIIAGTYTANLVASTTGVWLPLMNHTWTLAQEEQFYLVAPWLLRKMNLLRMRRWAIGIAVLAVLLAGLRLGVTMTVPELYRFTYENPVLNLDSMLAGVALAMVLRRGVVPRWIETLASSRAVILVAFSALVFAIFWAKLDGWTMSIATSITTVATLSILAHICFRQSAWTQVLSFRWMRWVGERVYGIYLYHVPIFVLLGVKEIEGPLERALMSMAATALSVAVAALSSRWIEQPVRSWVRNRSRQPAAVTV
ncbi:hypothetical protein NCCP1664_01760 [Zafaria cholistanensis]|uniref:Acyltransferase 3 domain-containing protein n=1 Tax=Zafaria cholistanensis TaxID=1682741 RepID=A0A5A7NM91_9MICC|nr:hypothetical protein NCCP1664_01760 [Zafaria cholistanensis]